MYLEVSLVILSLSSVEGQPRNVWTLFQYKVYQSAYESFLFISLLKVIGLMCWVSGGFTPLQVHLLTPLNMHYEPTPLWTIRKCFDIHLQFVEYNKYYKETVNPSVVQRCQIPLPVSRWDGKTVLETFLVSLFDGVPVYNCIKFGLLCRHNSSVISPK